MSDGARIVSNTGPLISLEKLSHGHDLIRRLYDKIVVPPVVFDEVACGLCDDTKTYLDRYGVTDLIELLQAGRINRKIYEALIAAI